MLAVYQLVHRLTGCTGTRVIQHQYRNGYGGLAAGHPRGHRPTANGSLGSYGGTHADISPYAENRWDGFADGRHCAMFNVWRSTDFDHDIEVMPLSVCDMQTVAFDDMVGGRLGRHRPAPQAGQLPACVQPAPSAGTTSRA